MITNKRRITSGSGRPTIVQSILTLEPSIDSLDLSGCVILGGELAKSPSVGGPSLTSNLQEDLVSPIQLVITTVNVPESSGNAMLISNEDDFGVFTIYKIQRVKDSIWQQNIMKKFVWVEQKTQLDN